MFERACHARDLGRPGANGFSGIAPGGCHPGHFFDNDTGLRQRESKIFCCSLEQFYGTSALVQIYVCRKDACLDICWNRVEVVGR